MRLRTVAIGTLAALAAQDLTHSTSATPSATAQTPAPEASDVASPLKTIPLQAVESVATPETLINPIFATGTSRRDLRVRTLQDAQSAAAVPNSQGAAPSGDGQSQVASPELPPGFATDAVFPLESSEKPFAGARAVARTKEIKQPYRIPPVAVIPPAEDSQFSQQETAPAPSVEPSVADTSAAGVSARLDALRATMRGEHPEGVQLPPLGAANTYLPELSPMFNGYMWPAQGVLTSGYGWRWGRMHKGIDIAAAIGTPIFAAAAGTVTYAGWDEGGYGNLVEIEHPDGSMTRYGHNNRILVRPGEQVEQGQQISEMGSTGFSTGPHLHFEIHPPGQDAVNPIAYLQGDPADIATQRRIGQGGP
ncbi:MAG: peptidoglycan DD-metalloendopeptidase family protein [Oscillatoria princeps RMCB-10]|jgi:murein DD-endopeptidase MepM/ murein hydrolase activator NlpD|nr:peptidoglycan DD-metalloendopeptidase family protein [Oscillatoria princeps RMCB-10]